MNSESDISRLLRAAHFAAEKHKDQRRKGADASPYINHPLKVAELLWRIGKVREVDCIVAAVLHDTIEDTATTPDELQEFPLFGSRVRMLVEEISDDKGLPKEERKRLQIEHASSLSNGAKQIKLADKIASVFDVAFAPAPELSFERRLEYLLWAESVVAGLRGCNPGLEGNFDEVLQKAHERLRGSIND
jgi:guanosine-3',5'-bis(diphosphate) 3'-pyrophosphohydrolase